MDAKTKNEILDLIQDLSYAYEEGSFWKEWSALQKYVSELEVKNGE